MATTRTTVAPPSNRVRLIVASSVMLTFISFWRAAAIVLNDLGSSAFYAGRHCGAGSRRGRTVVHPRHHAVQFRGARGVCRKLFDVHARRCLPGGERGTRFHFRQNQRFSPDVRLHPYGPYLRRFRGAIYYRFDERDVGCCGAESLAAPGPDGRATPSLPVQYEFNRCGVRGGCDHLLLVAEHQGHRGVQR